MSESPDKLEAIFDAVVALAPEDRPAYLAQACGADEDLRRQVERLLRNLDRAGNFLTQGEKGSGDSATRPPFVAESPGDRIGRYKLLQKIGEGGCGVVYMAEQEEPVRRRVALKIIKLGMDTKSVIARFEAERQALAMMDHPNIAKVFDAGATGIPLSDRSDTLAPSGGEGRGEGATAKSKIENRQSQITPGRPYFVMELVRGVKITDYCDEKSLSTRQRLDLFVQVCGAIQHAHQKGIIHRDIKPSNILVTVNDGVAVPKVIDFGIAKATTDQRLTDKTVFTAFEQFIGTPAYMSPEQAEITSVDVDTRSDIYSLGVLLYELLTGKTPFDAAELLKIGLDEMRRTIREREPDRPSTRVSTLAGEELTTTAKRRGLDAPKLANLLRGDLDWIVMKCLEKDRARRYETANGLAMDIQRHLKNEPVAACPPSSLYRFRKTVRRNKLAFAAAAIIVVLLVTVAGISMWEAIRTRRAELEQLRLRSQAEAARNREAEQRRSAEANQKKAELETAKAQQVSAFLEQMLQSVRPSVALGRDTTLLRDILDQAASQISTSMTNQPEVEIELLTAIANAYREINRLDDAERVNLRGLEIARKSFGAHAPEVGGMLIFLADTLEDQSRNSEAEVVIREALSIFKGQEGADSEHGVAAGLDRLGRSLRWQGRLSESAAAFRECFELTRRLIGSNSGATGVKMNNLANNLRDLGELKEAEDLLLQSLRIADENQMESLGLANTLHNLALTFECEGKLSEAEGAWRRRISLLEKLRSAPGSLQSVEDRLASDWNSKALSSILAAEEKTAEADELNRQALAQFRTAVAELNNELLPETPDMLRVRHQVFARVGRWKEAATDLTRLRDLKPNDPNAWFSLGALLVQDDRVEEYREHCRKSVERFSGSKDPRAANLIARSCLIVPSPGVDLPDLARMVNTSSVLDLASRNRTLFHFCKGLADYRLGNFSSAAEWMKKALSTVTGPGSPLTLKIWRWDPVERDVAAWALLAMSQYRMAQADRARESLATGMKLAQQKLRTIDEGDIGTEWVEWIIAQALLLEAKGLIGNQAPRNDASPD